MAGLGITGNMLVVATEELIYRSLFLPLLKESDSYGPAAEIIHDR